MGILTERQKVTIRFSAWIFKRDDTQILFPPLLKLRMTFRQRRFNVDATVYLLGYAQILHVPMKQTV